MRLAGAIVAVVLTQFALSEEVLVVPGIARTSGLYGSYFRTSLALTNPTAAEITVRLRFQPSTRFSSTTGSAVQVRLARGVMTSYRDVLTDLFHVAEDSAGAIFIDVDGARPVVSARTYNDGPQGTFGQHIEAQPLSSSAAGPIYGLAQTPSLRTNLGILNLDTKTAPFQLHESGFAAPVEISVEGGASVQLNQIDAARMRSTSFVPSVTGASRVLTYASVIDNGTSDPMFLTPQVAHAEQFIDGGAASHATLVLANPADERVLVEVEHYPGNVNRTGSATIALEARSVAEIQDFAKQQFNLSTNAGFLHLTSTKPIVAWSRMYDDVPGGTAGRYVPSIAPEELIKSRAIIHGLSENDSYRTQVYFFNATGGTIGLRTTIVDPAGTVRGSLAIKQFGVSPRQEYSFPLFATEMGFPNMGEYYLIVEPTVPGAGYVWASLIDRRSGDSTLIRPVE
jgi:hypothetical protein